ncbi:MAG: glycogen/starch synthase [Saprospiraceae bacterium]|nr:glycogen/starch synthase [Saprospiraceae bacterium]
MTKSKKYFLQRAFLTWLRDGNIETDMCIILDHHTSLESIYDATISFEFQSLSNTCIYNTHNERYQKLPFSWSKQYLLHQFDSWKSGLLDWRNVINPLASAVRCAYKVTTVSQKYMNRLMHDLAGLEQLLGLKLEKCGLS